MSDKIESNTPYVDSGSYKGKYPIERQWFLDRMAEKSISQEQLAKLTGIDRSWLSRLLNGYYLMHMDQAEAVSKGLGVPLGQVIQHSGVKLARSPLTDRRIPILETAGASGRIRPRSANTPQTVELPQDMNDAAGAVYIHAPANPVHGWVAFHEPATQVRPIAVGRLAVAQIADGGPKYLRILGRGFEQGLWTLQSLGVLEPTEIRNVRLAWAAPVIWIRC